MQFEIFQMFFFVFLFFVFLFSIARLIATEEGISFRWERVSK